METKCWANAYFWASVVPSVHSCISFTVLHAAVGWSLSVVVQISNDRKWPIAHLVAVRFPSALHENLACMLAMKHDEMKRWLEAGTDTVRRLEAALWWRSWHFLWSYGGIFKHGFYLVFWQVASLPRSSDIPGKYPLSIPIHHNSNCLFSPEVHSLDAGSRKKSSLFCKAINVMWLITLYVTPSHRQWKIQVCLTLLKSLQRNTALMNYCLL